MRGRKESDSLELKGICNLWNLPLSSCVFNKHGALLTVRDPNCKIVVYYAALLLKIKLQSVLIVNIKKIKLTFVIVLC